MNVCLYVGIGIVRFDELMKDERLLSQEVDALDRRFESWSLPSASASGINHAADRAKSQRMAPLPSSRDVTADLPPEVAAFEVKCDIFTVFRSFQCSDNADGWVTGSMCVCL